MRRATARGLGEASKLGLPPRSSVLGCPFCGAILHVSVEDDLTWDDLVAGKIPFEIHVGDDGSKTVVSRYGEAAAAEAEDACLEHLSRRHPWRLQLWHLTGWRWPVKGLL